jgi:prepilin-type N-terminal cleavage/methylation domain-containing protein
LERSGSRRRAAGFSLIEVLIATAVFATALIAVAQMFVVATRANSSARASTVASVLAQQKMEQLRSLTWGFDASGNVLSDLQSNLAVTPPTASGGPGLSASPAGTLFQSTAGYADYLDASGTWMGTGANPVAGTVYIRRWSVTPLPADPGNTLVLQVVVTRRLNRGGANAGAGTRLPDEARMTSLKTRKYL